MEAAVKRVRVVSESESESESESSERAARVRSVRVRVVRVEAESQSGNERALRQVSARLKLNEGIRLRWASVKKRHIQTFT